MENEAVEKLKQTALMNLYLLPHLLGAPPPARSDLWLGSNQEWPEYLEYIPGAYLELWSDSESKWARGISSNPGFTAIIDRWTEIHAELNDLPRGERRSQLVDEAWSLRKTPLIL